MAGMGVEEKVSIMKPKKSLAHFVRNKNSSSWWNTGKNFYPVQTYFVAKSKVQT
jgi:hypothetical protein